MSSFLLNAHTLCLCVLSDGHCLPLCRLTLAMGSQGPVCTMAYVSRPSLHSPDLVGKQLSRIIQPLYWALCSVMGI